MTKPEDRKGDQRYSPLVSLSHRLNKICEALLFLLMLAMIVVTTAQVAFRMVTQALTWSEELTRFLLVFCSLVGATVAFHRGAHISVTMVVDALPRPLRFLVVCFTNLAGVGFFIILARYGWQLMLSEARQMTPALGISMKWLYAMFPAFSAVTIVHLLANFEKYLRGGKY